MAATITTTQAALVASAGYQATSIYNSAGTYQTMGGLDLYNGRLYSGQFTSIVSMDTNGGSVSTNGIIPANAGNALVSVNPNNGTVYTAYGTSYSAPYVASIGYLQTGTYAEQALYAGIYDAARNSSGTMFINANTDINADDTADGARIYSYDDATGDMFEIAYLGGNSSGLTFDSMGNLFCSMYNEGKVVSFSSDQIANVLSGAAVLTATDAISEISLANAGYLAFDSNDNLYATYMDDSYGTHIIELEDDGSTTAIADGGGKLIADVDALYTIDTDWALFQSDIYKIGPEAVPEPASALLLLIGALGITAFRRYKNSIGA